MKSSGGLERDGVFGEQRKFLAPSTDLWWMWVESVGCAGAEAGEAQLCGALRPIFRVIGSVTFCHLAFEVFLSPSLKGWKGKG